MVSRDGEPAEHEFHSDDRVIVLSIAPAANETYVDVYGRDVTDEHKA